MVHGKDFEDGTVLTEAFADLLEATMHEVQRNIRAGRWLDYFFIACPSSWFYSDVVAHLDIDHEALLPHRIGNSPAFAESIRQGGFEPVPRGGIQTILIDTNDASAWFGGDSHMKFGDYRAKVAEHPSGFEMLEAAVSLDLDLRITGRFKDVLKKILERYIAAKTSNDYPTEAASIRAANSVLTKLPRATRNSSTDLDRAERRAS